MATLFDTIRRLVGGEQVCRGVTMRIPGKRVPCTRLVRTHNFVVAVEVEAVIPEDDDSEPCYEAEAVQLLRDVEEHAKQGDIEWLQRHGRVYQALETALHPR